MSLRVCRQRFVHRFVSTKKLAYGTHTFERNSARLQSTGSNTTYTARESGSSLTIRDMASSRVLSRAYRRVHDEGSYRNRGLIQARNLSSDITFDGFISGFRSPFVPPSRQAASARLPPAAPINTQQNQRKSWYHLPATATTAAEFSRRGIWNCSRNMQQQAHQEIHGESSTTPVSIDGIREAAIRIGPHVSVTPVVTCHAMDELSGGRNLFFKCELFQKTGSFKARGACNAVLLAPSSCRDVVTHSSGNHAQVRPCCRVRPVPSHRTKSQEVKCSTTLQSWNFSLTSPLIQIVVFRICP